MIDYTRGNLLEAPVEALVNTVNTVGVMGKGIALMFKESFPENYRQYRAACDAGEVKLGKVFVTERRELMGPSWIINFPTKKHWRGNSRLEWIADGLDDLQRVITEYNIHSIAIPPLGTGNGGLEWGDVRALMEDKLFILSNTKVLVYEPTGQYQNVAKTRGVEQLTPARALITELVRRYWVLGIECSLLEIQKLAWFLEKEIRRSGVENPLKLDFHAGRYGPFTNKLTHLLNDLDGSFLHCTKRLGDATPTDVIWVDESRKDFLKTYLKSADVAPYLAPLEEASNTIEGYQSPLGMELISTVDWLITVNGCKPTVPGIKTALENWPGGSHAGTRKLRLFDDRLIDLALKRLAPCESTSEH